MRCVLIRKHWCSISNLLELWRKAAFSFLSKLKLCVEREDVQAMKFGANDRFVYASFTQFLNHAIDILFTQHKQTLPEEYRCSLYSGFAKEYLKNLPCYISYLRHSWKTYIVFHNLKPHSTALHVRLRQY